MWWARHVYALYIHKALFIFFVWCCGTGKCMHSTLSITYLFCVICWARHVYALYIHKALFIYLCDVVGQACVCTVHTHSIIIYFVWCDGPGMCMHWTYTKHYFSNLCDVVGQAYVCTLHLTLFSCFVWCGGPGMCMHCTYTKHYLSILCDVVGQACVCMVHTQSIIYLFCMMWWARHVYALYIHKALYIYFVWYGGPGMCMHCTYKKHYLSILCDVVGKACVCTVHTQSILSLFCMMWWARHVYALYIHKAFFINRGGKLPPVSTTPAANLPPVSRGTISGCRP